MDAQKITRTTDSFNNPQWKVHYTQCGKNRRRCFYNEAQAIRFAEILVPTLINEPIAKPRKQRGRSREIPKW